jgi:hypothetical protein
MKALQLCLLVCFRSGAAFISLQQRAFSFPRVYRCNTFTRRNRSSDDRLHAAIASEETSLIPQQYNSCPFRSRFYPRTNTPLFRQNKDAPRKNFWLPGQRSLVKFRFLNQLQQRRPNCVIEWRDDVVEMQPYSAVSTLAALWQSIANATNTCSVTPITRVLAFPDANGNVIEQWVQLINWYMDQQQNMTIPYKLDVSFDRTVVDFVEIPSTIVSCELFSHQPSFSLIDTSAFHLDHETIVRRTKSWVQRILVDHSICPFTKSVTYSGQGLSDVNVPVGRISYHVTESVVPSSPSTSCLTAMCQLQADTWHSMYDMLLAGPVYSKNQNLNGISSILLAAPGWDDHFAEWSGPVFALLEAGVIIADATEIIGVVCFHPHYQTPDGRSFPGFGHMHSVLRLQQWLKQYEQPLDVQKAAQQSIPDLIASKVIADDANSTFNAMDNPKVMTALAAAGGAWQRRTPHATINVLRADQLAAAEGKRSTPSLYATNILRLVAIGWKQLAAALDHERQLR